MPSTERSFGPYDVLARIGAGGMGEVFKARDRRLDRVVALKTSREQFTARFAQEARASAALNHPHIATLHDVGPDYLVMEFVDGETLQGPLPTARAVLYARQILDALDAAHRKGIVHCDLKPANILIAKSGVKLLDFGLAQVKQKLAIGDETATMALPAEGAIAGTLQYMAPEQLQGKPADPRTDIFAFGLVFYEMLTGRRVFEGENAASVISAIMTAEPPVLPESKTPVPGAIDRIIRQCLVKDPDERWQSAADIKHALDLIEVAPALAATTATIRRFSWWGPAAGLAVGALITFALLWLTRPAVPPPWTFQPITYSGRAFNPVLSPDGKQVAFAWIANHQQDGLYVQLVNGGNPLLLPVRQVRGRVAWSPDSSRIAFVTDTGVSVMPALGGAERRVVAFPQSMSPSDVAWSPNGSFFVLDTGFRKGLSSVPAEGGEFKVLSKPAAATDYRPAISPDGRSVAFVRRNSTYNTVVMVLPVAVDGAPSGPERAVTTGVWNVNSLDWASDGKSIVFEGSPGGNNPSLWRVAVSGGTPVRLNMPSMISAAPTISRQSDRLIYVNTQYETGVFKVGLGSHAGGEPQKLVDAIGDQSDMAVSHDGARIAFVSNRTGAREVWIAKSDGSGQTQLTFFGGPAVGSPRWSPDGTQIVFDGYASGSSDIYLISAEGGKPARLTTDSGNEVRPAWSHDGQWIYYSWDRQGHRRSIWKIRPTGGESVQAVPEGNNALETPDGKWLYYSNTPKLWRVPANGTGTSEASSSLDSTNDWNVGGKNVFMVDSSTADLFRAPLGDGKFEKVYHFENGTQPSGEGPAFALPDDESYFIYRRTTRSVNTLVLIEGFR